jgi:polysaccharide export outer membrane protein
MRRSFESVMLAMGMAVLAHAQAPQQAKPPAQTQQPPVSLSPAMPVDPGTPTDPARLAPATAPVDAATFVLGVEDQISITMWDEPKFDGSYMIRPDGKISMKLIGEIQAGGLTPLELQEAINKAALSQLKNPRATVNVIGVHSKHVYFDGDGIATPGAMDLVIPVHLLEAISARGGFRDFADKKHIRILRDGKVFMTVNYKDLISGKHPESNPLLQDKDHVIVK